MDGFYVETHFWNQNFTKHISDDLNPKSYGEFEKITFEQRAQEGLLSAGGGGG